MIELANVHKRYGDVVALDGVDLSVAAGDALGLVGTNGAGKTTLFRLLVGHERPDEGRVRVAGLDPTAGPGVRRVVGYLPEAAGFQPALTGREVLGFYADARGLPDADADTDADADADADTDVDGLLSVVGLADAADRRVGTYSNGMTRRLGLATALLGDPAVLLLDEPTSGLDPGGVDAFADVLGRVRAEREVTVVLSTHVIREVERLCDRVAVLEAGRVATAGAVGDVVASVDAPVTVRARYADSGDAVGRIREAVPAATVTPTADGLAVACDRDRVTDVLGVVVETDPDGVTVDEPGLAEAFRETADLGGETA